MWKKHGSALLGLILTIALFITGIKLPEYVAAAGSDKTSLVAGKDSTTFVLSQKDSGGSYYPITDTTKIDTNKEIKVEMSFEAIFNETLQPDERINKGDYVQFDLGDRLKFAGADESSASLTLPITDTESKLKICDAVFTKDSATGHITVKFDFSNSDDAVFEMKSGKVGASVSVMPDVTKLDWEKNSEKTIKLFGKDYEVGYIEGELIVKKTGKLDPKNHKVDWTIEIERHVKGMPDKQLSLEGYRVRDLPSTETVDGVKYGDFIRGTYKINDRLVEESNKYEEGKLHIYDNGSADYEYTITAGDLDASNVGKAVVTLSTVANFGINQYGSINTTESNRAQVSKPYGSGESADVWASVNLVKFGKKEGKIDESGKKIIWTVEFNEPPYELGTVKISDEFTPDRTGRIEQKFLNAKVQRWDEANKAWGAVSTLTAISNTGNNYTFSIDNVNEKIKVTFETEIEPDSVRADFDNDAYVWWNDKEEYKVKLSGSVSTTLPGGQTYGDISKTAKNHSFWFPFVGFEPEWTISADSKVVPVGTGDYYMYDVLIFDENVAINKKTVNEENGFSLKKVGDPSVTSLAGNVSLAKIMPEGGTHQKLVNINDPLTNKTDGITNAVYEIVKDGKTVGHVLEVKLVPGVANKATFKSRIMDKSALVNDNTYNGSRVANRVVLAKNGKTLLTKDAEYNYLSRILAKSTLSRDAAKKLQKDYDAVAANADIYDDTANSPYYGYKGVAKNNQSIAYDRETKSVYFWISVNAADIKDVDGDIGKFVLKDTLPFEFQLAPIKKDAANPANDKYFLVYRGTSADKYPGTNDTLTSLVSTNVVKAVSGALTDAELTQEGISGEVVKNYENIKNQLNVTFDKLNGPYVVLVKAELRNDIPQYTNKMATAYNNVSLTLDKYTANRRAAFDYDGRFLTKGIDGDKVNISDNGYIKWNLNYIPYKVYNDNNATKLRIEDKLNGNLVLRKEKGTGNLVFEGDNYKIWKGEIDKDGKFVNPVEITEGLDKIFTYDTTAEKLVINIPDNDSVYKISYITDFADNAKPGDKLSNEAALIETSKQIGSTVTVNHKIDGTAWGSLTKRTYERLQIVKTDENGEKLAGAKFTLTRLANGANPKKVIGTFDSVTNSAIVIEKLTSGEYELTEDKTPDGYDSNGIVYKIKVTQLESGFKVEFSDEASKYDGKAKLSENELTIINKKKPVTPPTPVVPPTPVNPTPVVPPTPVNPTPVVPPTPVNPTPLIPVNPTPENPTPVIPITPTPTPTTPITPATPSTITPTPNSPKTPDGVVVDEDKTPQGKVVKTNKPKGKNNQIVDDDDTPLGGNKAKKNLPKTGGTSTVWYYVAGIGLVFVAGLVFKRRKEEK